MTDTPLSQLIAERKEAEVNGALRPALTDRDARNLADFGQCAAEMISVLDAEMATLSKCDLAANEAIYAQKVGLVQRLDRLAPLLEPFFPQLLEEDAALRAQLDQLSQKVAENETLLARMAEATQAIAGEHARILDRHSLNGLYAKSGKKRGAPTPQKTAIDEHL